MYYYDNKPNFTNTNPNNPHIGYGKNLAFIPSTLRYGISSIFYFLLESLLFVTSYITNNPHIGYGKHLAFIPSKPRYGILENGALSQVNHT